MKVNEIPQAANRLVLGDGTIYGSRLMPAADQGNVVEIDLTSSAIAALNLNHSLLGMGGSLTTLDALANTEIVFAFSSRTNGLSDPLSCCCS